jgi:hypothetical protein
MIATVATIYESTFTASDPITEPVTKDEVKDWSIIDFDDKDTQIPFWITAERKNIENWLGGVKLVNGEASFKVKVKCSDDFIKFPHALELLNVENLVVNKIVDGEADEEMTIDEDYYFDSSLRITGYGTYRINYDVVYDEIPQDLKQAILMMIDYRYINKGGQEKQQGIPADVESILKNYRVTWL